MLKNNQAIYCQRCGTICHEIQDGELKRSACPGCGYIYYMNPYPCVSVLIAGDDGKVLLGRRGTDSIYPLKWCLPCGYIEYNETYVEASIRETKEETGIKVEPIGIINVVSNHFADGVNSIVTVILAKPVETEIKAGDDMIEIGWFDVNAELPDLAFKADAYIINKYKKSFNNKLKMNCLDLLGNRFQ